MIVQPAPVRLRDVFLERLEEKLLSLLLSRKFWMTVAALLTTASAYLSHQVTPEVALAGALATIVGFLVSTGIEDAGRATGQSTVVALPGATVQTPPDQGAGTVRG